MINPTPEAKFRFLQKVRARLNVPMEELKKDVCHIITGTDCIESPLLYFNSWFTNSCFLPIQYPKLNVEYLMSPTKINKTFIPEAFELGESYLDTKHELILVLRHFNNSLWVVRQQANISNGIVCEYQGGSLAIQLIDEYLDDELN